MTMFGNGNDTHTGQYKCLIGDHSECAISEVTSVQSEAQICQHLSLWPEELYTCKNCGIWVDGQGKPLEAPDPEEIAAIRERINRPVADGKFANFTTGELQRMADNRTLLAAYDALRNQQKEGEQ